MGYLKRMVREQSHVVIASIHQPRSAIWLMFDAVTLLASGRLMYHGPREGITPWFGSLGYHYDPSLHGVPSDWCAPRSRLARSAPRADAHNVAPPL
jgi:ABC-type multidrug transport system ATPase subunit